MEALQKQAARLNSILEKLPNPQERLRFVIEELGSTETIALTTSFGMQSALMLQLVTDSTRATNVSVPVIWIDTGYLPKETYEFAAELTEKLDLDLRVYQSDMTPARMEAMFGKLWEEESIEAHKKYNHIRKVEPMKRALKNIGATVVLSGVRSDQTSHRKAMQMVHVHDGRLKVCPVLDWTDEQVNAYFEEKALLYHPLREQGYVSVGDWHSSAPFDPNIHKNERDTRFHGRTQECGLHLSDPEPEDDKKGMVLSTSSSSIDTTLTTDSDGFLLYTKPNCRFCKAAKALLQYLRNDEQMKSLLSVSNEKENKEAALKQTVADDDTSLTSSMTSSVVFDVVDEVTVGKGIQPSELSQALGGREVKTVPQIVYKGTYIGGYEDLVQWVESSFPHYSNLPDTVQLVEQFRQH